MIEATGLGRRFGDRLAVENLSVTLQPGIPRSERRRAGFEAMPSPVDGLQVFPAFLVIVLGLSWFLFEKRDA